MDMPVETVEEMEMPGETVEVGKMEMPGVTMEVGSDGVAVISFFNPPDNFLDIPILVGIKQRFEEAVKRDDAKAIVVYGKGGKFSSGFDINGIGNYVRQTGDDSFSQDLSIELLVNTIGDAKKPAVAAIGGHALGGGLELAMACHARVAIPRVQLGIPELTLGIIPGFGGTQLLPRLVGLPSALVMLLFSRLTTSDAGKYLGLIDKLASPGELLNVSRLWALDIAERRNPWLRTLNRTDQLDALSDALKLLRDSRQEIKKFAPNMPQHRACIDAIEEGFVHGAYNGVLREAKEFKELVLSDTSKALVHISFAKQATSQVPNVTDIGLKPRPVKKVAVIGGGLMGSGIATELILSNFVVLLKEINTEHLHKGMKAIEANVQGLVSTHVLEVDKAEQALAMLRGVSDYSDFGDVDMVIEAMTENISLKQNIFSEIEKACPPHCILATNTSTIDLNIIGERTRSQDRVVGAHFFSLTCVMPLLEIVRTEKTSAQVILDLMTVGKINEKVPVVVGNCTGFAVNRAFFPYSQGAHFLLHMGVDPFRIDQLICNFGFPMGPFQLQDVAGYGDAVAFKKIFGSAFAGRTFHTSLVDLLMENGRNGKSNGKGYYVYEKGSKPKPDPSVLPIIEESRELANVMPGGKHISISNAEIVEMILFPVVNESCRILDEGIVVRASDLDVASVLAMSFPSYRGGIVFWADTVGAEYIYRSLKKWTEAYGDFYKPSKFLEERATRGIPLSAPKSITSAPKSHL